MLWNCCMRAVLVLTMLIQLCQSIPEKELYDAKEHKVVPEAVAERKEAMLSIKEWNEAVYGIEACKVVDLTTIPEVLPRDTVISWINGYSFPAYPLVNGAPRPEGYQEAVLAVRNLEGIPAEVSVQYGVITGYAAVRSFPTADAIQNEVNGFDYFQETGFAPGECVIVCHYTADGSYAFVRGEYYAGWVSTGNIAMTDRETLFTWQSRQQRAFDCVVTLEYMELSGMRLPMGTVLPVTEQTETGYTVGLPVKSPEGNLTWQNEEIPWEQVSKNGVSTAEQRFSCGYLDATMENLMIQGERCVSVPYGWGDTGGNPDCSSTVRSIYRCFGFRLPRNTSAQIQMPGNTWDFTGLSTDARRALLTSMSVGTILYFPGHVMVYWGLDAAGEPVILHNTTHYVDETGTPRSAYACVKTSVYIRGGDGRTFLDRVTKAVDLSMYFQ